MHRTDVTCIETLLLHFPVISIQGREYPGFSSFPTHTTYFA